VVVRPDDQVHRIQDIERRLAKRHEAVGAVHRRQLPPQSRGDIRSGFIEEALLQDPLQVRALPRLRVSLPLDVQQAVLEPRSDSFVAIQEPGQEHHVLGEGKGHAEVEYAAFSDFFRSLPPLPHDTVSARLYRAGSSPSELPRPIDILRLV
jgi:hypothetical protein